MQRNKKQRDVHARAIVTTDGARDVPDAASSTTPTTVGDSPSLAAFFSIPGSRAGSPAGGDAGPRDTGTVQNGDWCTSLCTRLKSCAQNIDDSACLTKCAASTEFSQAAGAVIAECANTVECTANFTSIGAIDACIENKWPTATTAGAEQSCEAFASAAAQASKHSVVTTASKRIACTGSRLP